MSFETSLTITLTLSTTLKSISVEAGKITELSLSHRADGFDARFVFWVVGSDDPLFETFRGTSLLTAKFSIDRTFDLEGETAESIALSGLVVSKQVSERAFEDVAGQPVLQRRYTIEVWDRGRALWSEHYPTALYADKTLAQLLAANLPEGVSLTASATCTTATRPILAFGLGAGDRPASYYDFLQWLCDRECAWLVYDASAGSYELASAKKVATAPAVEVVREDVAELETVFPPIGRATVSVLNGSSKATVTSKALTNADAVTGVKRNYLISSSVAATLDARATREAARHAAPMPETHLTFRRYPSITMRPHQRMSFDEEFSTTIFQHGKTYRLERIELTASALAETVSLRADEGASRYRATFRAVLEHVDDVAPRPRRYATPVFPFEVEGTIVSEQGNDGEATHQAYADAQTSVESYKIKIPVFESQVVIAPYTRSLMAGRFYFPAYRDAKVVVSFDFESASIQRFVDWRAGARQPQDGQGTGIQFGKKPSDGTSIVHRYEDQKPVLAIERLQDKDTQKITISDGTILISTQETS